jgi:hypothetical protein
MIANFFLLAMVGGGMIAVARRRRSVAMVSLLIIPLKLTFFLGVTYLIIGQFQVNVPGFVAGVLTQFVAIFIEVWRPAPSAAPSVASQ